MRWEQGRDQIEAMIGHGLIDRVNPSREHADRLLHQARRHVTNARNAAQQDPEGAYGTLYDAGRKA